MKITNLQTNHITNPIAYMMDKPVFSYIVEEALGRKQTAARIMVATDEKMSNIVFDSGMRRDIDSIAYKVEMLLEPCTRYYWNVIVETDAEESCKSEVAWFETGKMQEEWQGQWICSDFNDDQHPKFLKDFFVDGKIKQARLYICGLGLYEAYLGDKKIGDEYLAPYSNNYDQWLQYQTYDIGKMLQDGANILSVLLGNGWYKGRFGLVASADTKPDKLYGDKFLLIAEVAIEYTDGRKVTVATDETWKMQKSKIMGSSFYDGEICDDSFADDTFYPVKIAQDKMSPLRERLSLPVLVKEVLNPIRMINTPKNELVLDLGQNHSGIFSLQVREKKGTTIKLWFGEELQDGCFFDGNLRTGKQEYTYTSDGISKTIRPHFVTFGYRYVKIEGASNFKIDDYKSLVLYSDLTQTGHIETGNELVNKLALNALWGQKSNFIDVPMDCPQRDERMGWTGDAQVFAPTACYNMDCYSFYRKYLYDMFEEQKMRGGAVPFCVPACGQTNSSGIWGDAATLIPWNVYEMYGDLDIIAAQYESMKAWVDYIKMRNGDDWKWRNIFHFGDWLALDSRNPSMPTGGTDTGFIATVYYYNSTRLVAQAAKLLNKNDDAKEYHRRADELKAEIVNEYFSPYGRACVGTQTGLLMALHFDLTPNRPKTIQALKKAFKDNNNKLETGFVGTALLNTVLSENAMDDLAYTLLLNEEYPGWLCSVKRGATTIWERWDSLDENGHFSKSGLNSLNHYSYGSIVGWLYKYCAGLQPSLDAPGFRQAIIAPHPDWRLNKVDATIKTPIGEYRSAWRVSETYGLTIEVTVPFGGEAKLILPYASDNVYMQKNDMFKNVIETPNGKQCILAAGRYHIEYETTVPMRKYFTLNSTISELLENEKAAYLLKKYVPMISMLPPSMHGRTFREVLSLLPEKLSEKTTQQIENELKVII